MVGDLSSIIKKTYCLNKVFVSKLVWYIFTYFVYATCWKCYLCLRVGCKRLSRALRVKTWGGFCSTIQRDATPDRIVHLSMDLVWWCWESIDDTSALAPQILNGPQIESNYTSNINVLITDLLALSMAETMIFLINVSVMFIDHQYCI